MDKKWFSLTAMPIKHSSFAVVLGLVVSLSLVSFGHTEELYVLRPNQVGGPMAYQISRSTAAAQPKWSMGQPLPVSIEKLARIALEKTIPANSSDAKFWKVEHIYFFRMDAHSRGLSPHFQATTDTPPDLQDRWFCEFQLSCYKNYSGVWWENTKYAVVLLDGTYVPPTMSEGAKK